jgi:hypothetical protein
MEHATKKARIEEFEIESEDPADQEIWKSVQFTVISWYHSLSASICWQ